jgi:hypothetical protein
MAVKNLTRATANIWIPTESDTYVKIVIISDDGTEYTVMDTYGGSESSNFTIDASCSKSASDKLGSFYIRLVNDEGRFLDTFNGGETVKIYCDITDATTLIFCGRIDDISYGLNSNNGWYIELYGRDYPELSDKTVSGIEVSVTADVSLAGVLNEFYPDLTLVFWNSGTWATATYTKESDSVVWSPAVTTFPTNLINTSYQHKSGVSVISEICEIAGLDWYIEYNETLSRYELRTLIKDSITNPNAGVSYGVNLISLDNYGTENSDIINRVIYYGKTDSDNVLLVRTKDDSASQSNLWVKEKVIDDGSANSMRLINSKATYELNKNMVAIPNGGATVTCLPLIRPGDNIYASVPYCGIYGLYRVESYTHTFGIPMTTSIQLSKKLTKISDLFIKKVNAEEIVGKNPNINNMKDSLTILFDESPSMLSELVYCEEVDSKLMLISAATYGYAISTTLNLDYNATECELRKFESYDVINDTYEVSNNNGVTWESYSTSGDIHKFANPGSQIKLKINLSRTSTSAPSPSYECISLLVK